MMGVLETSLITPMRTHALAAIPLILVLLPAPAPGAGLTETEEALAAWIDAHQGEALALLERAVNINSGTLNTDGVRKAGDLFRAEFEKSGFATRWIDGAPFGRAGHLLAEYGSGTPHVLLIGHLDTVFEPDSPFQKYELRDAQTASGPGTSDMKGGIVLSLYALRALAAHDRLGRLRVTVLLTGDEEDTGEPLELARAALIEAAQAADIAIGLENGDDDPATAVIARRGASSWKLEVEAKSAHSSQIFREDIGSGAIYELARILESIHSELRGEEYLTFNPGVVLGGAQVDFDAAALTGRVSGKNNIIAPRAVATGDLRAISIEQRERAKTKMREIANARRPHAAADITFTDSYPPLAPTPGNHALLQMLDEVSRDLGYGGVTAVDPARAGAADISFTAGYVDKALDGLGLLGGGNHTPEEFANLRTFRIQAQRLAILLHRLGHNPSRSKDQ
jgi:glutamate carboxypeptidase